MEKKYPGSEALNELQIKCGKCKCVRTLNRLRYVKHFGDSKCNTILDSLFKIVNVKQSIFKLYVSTNDAAAIIL